MAVAFVSFATQMDAVVTGEAVAKAYPSWEVWASSESPLVTFDSRDEKTEDEVFALVTLASLRPDQIH